ncbi:unnamed protein product [Ostreobium quekettii]|uniref:4a-hydroxytetrahydrobiopterin dehydratase n=1 Tax=Ostreobium quekettii TaxID=121088 RepID=A0A8S1IX28_9CHLO|nr:unnamed protein product [Ostreobium quekettii]
MLAAVPEWAMSEDRSCLKRFLVAKNFTTAMKFFEAVADIAEEEGHHPDLQLRDKRLVEVSLSTHPIRGVSLRDFVVASKINAVELEYSPKWLREREEEQQK